MADEFHFWRDALAGKPVTIHEDAPQPGYYKMRDASRRGAWLPVAIWRLDGVLVCRVANKTVNPLDVWTFCVGHPVSKDDAKHAFETGSWPGDAPEIGHNSGDLSLAQQIAEYASMALAWLAKTGVKDKTTADVAANYRAKLNQLKKEADDARTAEKAPHLAKAREVDDKWRVPIAEATAAAEDIRAALTQFMVAEEKRLRAEQEAARKAEEERIARERAEKMASDPIAAMTDPEPELPMAPEPVKVQAGGQRGRRTGLRTVKKVRITDYQAAAAHFAANEEIKVVLDKLTSRLVLAGANVPFAETYDEKVAA
jgi:hypothetical protein